MLIYSSGNLTALEAGQPLPPSETSANQVGPGFASVTIMNESPWGLSFVNANAGSFPLTPWSVATIPVSPGDSWHISPQEPLFIDGNYLMPPGVSNVQTQVVAQFSRTPTAYSIRELFTISATEITGTTQVTVDTSGGPIDVSGNVAITNATLDITGPVTITGGQTGTNVATELPDDFTFGTQVTPFSINFTALNQTLTMLTMAAGNTYSLLYCIFSINPPGSNSILIQGVASNGAVMPINQVWTGTPLQSIIVPMFLVSQPSSGTNQLEILCNNFATSFEVYGSIISRTGAPSNVAPWLT